MVRTSSLKAIERRIGELQAKAAEIRRTQQEGVEQLRAVMVKYKLGPVHLRMAMSGGDRASRRRPSPAKLKAPPRYRNPENAADVWSGRGRKPSWLVAALNDGRTIDEFLIRDAREETSGEPTVLN